MRIEFCFICCLGKEEVNGHLFLKRKLAWRDWLEIFLRRCLVERAFVAFYDFPLIVLEEKVSALWSLFFVYCLFKWIFEFGKAFIVRFFMGIFSKIKFKEGGHPNKSYLEYYSFHQSQHNPFYHGNVKLNLL